MGTIINEVGSTAGGVAKVEYKDQSGNVLWYYDDAGNFVRNGNAKITGLAGTGTRLVTSDSNGSLSVAPTNVLNYYHTLNGAANSSYCKILTMDMIQWTNGFMSLEIQKGSYDNCSAETKIRIGYSSRGGNATSVRVRWNGTFTNDSGENSIRVYNNTATNKIEIYANKSTGYADVFFNMVLKGNATYTIGSIASATLPVSGEIVLTSTADDKGV